MREVRYIGLHVHGKLFPPHQRCPACEKDIAIFPEHAGCWPWASPGGGTWVDAGVLEVFHHLKNGAGLSGDAFLAMLAKMAHVLDEGDRVQLHKGSFNTSYRCERGGYFVCTMHVSNCDQHRADAWNDTCFQPPSTKF